MQYTIRWHTCVSVYLLWSLHDLPAVTSDDGDDRWGLEHTLAILRFDYLLVWSQMNNNWVITSDWNRYRKLVNQIRIHFVVSLTQYSTVNCGKYSMYVRFELCRAVEAASRQHALAATSRDPKWTNAQEGKWKSRDHPKLIPVRKSRVLFDIKQTMYKYVFRAKKTAEIALYLIDCTRSLRASNAAATATCFEHLLRLLY